MSKIMLVEDDNSLREIYQARLLAEGYEIVTAQDGEEALALVAKEKPDLIILDVMMPKISGFDTLDIIRSTPNTKDIKVIMMTALSQAEDKARAEKLGADRYLVKSQVTLEDIVKAAKEVLGGAPETAAATPNPLQDPAPQPNPAAPPSPDATPPIDTTTPPSAPSPEPPLATQDLSQVSNDPAGSSLDVNHSGVASTDPNPAEPNAPAPVVESLGDQGATGNDPLGGEPALNPADQAVQSDPNPLNPNPVADAPANPVLSLSPAPGQNDAASSLDASEPTDTPEAAAPADSQPQATDDDDDSPKAVGGQRVIQPIDDPSKSPDLDTLLASEALKETSTNVPPPPENSIVGTSSGVTESSTDPTASGADSGQAPMPGGEQTPPAPGLG